MTRLIRTVHFQCLHRYENPAWDPVKNAAEFGACFTPHGHGHSYKMEVCVAGPIDKETGMVINLKDLDEVLKSVVGLVDKKHLNFEVAEFKTKIPTTENLLQFLYDHLAPRFREAIRLIRVRLYENDDLWAEVVC
jgi:6-pyruvoyltetrahydropterin/6-carboxytetrahydropterin synthase